MVGSVGIFLKSLSLSSSYPKNAEEVRQASAAASDGTGTATVGSVEKQGTTLGRISELPTATAHVGENGDGGTQSASAKDDDVKPRKPRTINIATLSGKQSYWAWFKITSLK